MLRAVTNSDLYFISVARANKGYTDLSDVEIAKAITTELKKIQASNNGNG